MNHLASGNRGEVGNGEIQVPATNYGRPERAVGAVPHRQHGRCQHGLQSAWPYPSTRRFNSLNSACRA